MNNEYLEKEFRKKHAQMFSIKNNSVVRNNTYIENKPKRYDLSYDIKRLKDFKFGELFREIEEYMKSRKFYMPITVIIKNEKVIEDGIYVFSAEESVLFRIRSINEYILSEVDKLDKNCNCYITVYVDIKYAVYLFREKSYAKSMMEIGRIISYIYSKNKYLFTEYDCNIYTFSKAQGIDITLFAQCCVIGVKMNEW